MTQQSAKSVTISSNDVALLTDIEVKINASLMKDSSCFKSDNTFLPLLSIPGCDTFQIISLCLNSSCNSVMTR